MAEEDLPNESLMIKGDAEQLKQVCWNVARNALEDTMPDGGEFRISAQRTDAKRVQIRFRDSGHGMTRNRSSDYSEPFTSTTGGTGLGALSFIKLFATIVVQSTFAAGRTEGTTITV
jgi:signal transduction histidine kinase